ncbi:MAG TPA: glycosyltransferase 87 family protein, partial [Solirubrobacteraceae bacterium]|nr:glycosyltransferase 87 family protein [Solirubrobacteraceae bacterium]
AALLAAGCLYCAAAAPAGAARTVTSAPLAPARATTATTPPDPNGLTTPATQDRPPPGHVRSADQVEAAARRVPRIAEMLRRHRGHTATVYMKGAERWQVSFFDPLRAGKPRKEIGQVLIDDRTGAVLEAWTGHQVPWSMARGYPGAFGRKANAWYLWIPLCVLFVLPFVDPRRPFRLLHLDLLVLVGFSVSLAFFNHGEIGLSVPLAYPPLVYLLVRMLTTAFGRGAPSRPRRGPPRPIRLLVPATWLAVAIVFLLGFRWALNVANSNVIDVGYAGVIGADKLMDGTRLYGAFPSDNQHGDTYGPAVYYAYVPFEQALPWSGRWDDLPAAHAAAIFFDALTALLLFLLGRRVRGPTLGIALAYGWAAFPFTLYALNSNSNDALVAALVVLALLVASHPVPRGAVTALAGLTKFAPLALGPLFATYREPGADRSRVAEIAWFAAAAASTAAAVLLPAFLGAGFGVFWERTIEFQRERGSPFSVWGFREGYETAQHVVQAGAVVLALVVALVPRRRDVVTLAALAAAVLVAVQLGVTHWFYLYVVWFLPPVLLALLGRDLVGRDEATPAAAQPAAARSSPPVAAPTP